MLIGMYCANDYLDELLKTERAYYMAAEAFMQGGKLIIFSIKDVNFDKKTVSCHTRENNSWVRATTPFPDVMINLYTGLKEGLKKEFMLRAEVPFTSNFTNAKRTFFAQIKEAGRFDNLLIPYDTVNSIGIIDEYLIKYKKIIVKPSMGARGLGIYQISGDYDKYLVKDNNKVHKLDRHKLKLLVDDFIKKKYLVQPYIECQTSLGEPFDFRIHVQKNGEGIWQITRSYARIGTKGSILSNISRGGMFCNIDYFLKVEYGDRASYWKDKLEAKSFAIAEHIEEIYKQSFDELGIDLAIDKDDNLWLYEVNSGPQSRYHEPQRARNAIAYAIYIANRYKDNEQSMLLSLSENVVNGIDAIKEMLVYGDKHLYRSVKNMMDTMECFGFIEKKLISTISDYEAQTLYTSTEVIKAQLAEIVGAYEKNNRTEAVDLVNYLSKVLLVEWMDEIKKINRQG